MESGEARFLTAWFLHEQISRQVKRILGSIGEKEAATGSMATGFQLRAASGSSAVLSQTAAPARRSHPLAARLRSSCRLDFSFFFFFAGLDFSYFSYFARCVAEEDLLDGDFGHNELFLQIWSSSNVRRLEMTRSLPMSI